MKDAPLVSIVIPAYNHEAFVQQTLDSIEAQSYPNIEVVLVNDGSRDRTGAIAQAHARRSRHKFTYLEHPNQGLVKTVARGYANSTGEMVSFLASDDWLFPDKIEVQVRDMLENDADAVYGNIANVMADRIPRTYKGAREFLGHWDPEAFIERLVTAHGPMLQAGLFRRSLIEAIGGVDQGLEQEDWPIHILVARTARKVRVHVEPVVYYRYHSGNMVLTKSRQLVRWKTAIADKYLTGRARRHAKGSAHDIHARTCATTEPWGSLGHFLLAQLYYPRGSRRSGYWRKVLLRGLPDWGWRVLHHRGKPAAGEASGGPLQ
jgi:alpha-1,3-rhamnosyltransferase